MKIIAVDNYAREWKPERLVLAGLPEDTANKITDILNDDLSGPDALDFYKVVENDHELYPGEEP